MSRATLTVTPAHLGSKQHYMSHAAEELKLSCQHDSETVVIVRVRGSSRHLWPVASIPGASCISSDRLSSPPQVLHHQDSS